MDSNNQITKPSGLSSENSPDVKPATIENIPAQVAGDSCCAESSCSGNGNGKGTPKTLESSIVVQGRERQHQILVCNGTFCGRDGKSVMLIKEFRRVVEEKGLSDRVSVQFSGCFGFCPYNSNVGIQPGSTVYSKVKDRHVEEIVQSHILDGVILEKKKCPGSK